MCIELIPAWLEPLRIPERSCSTAWDATSASLRACIKTGIALAHFHFGSSGECIEKRRTARRLGFKESMASQPAPWGCLIFGPEQNAAARICAASILPRLAGVENLIAICAGGQPSAGLLITLELCGIEDIFQTDKSQCWQLLRHLASLQVSGSVCFLHAGQLDALYLKARELYLRAINLAVRPRLLLLDQEAFDPAALKFCLGDLPATDPQAEESWDCVYAVPARQLQLHALMRLAPGCEGFWLFPGYELDFYVVTSRAFAMC